MVDDENRENEGDLIIPEIVDDKAINFMATHGRGLICLSLTEERVKKLELPLCHKIMIPAILLLLQFL